MKSDLTDMTDVIASLVLQAAPDLDSRLEYQAEALREAKCTNPLVGKWIDSTDVKYLFSTLALRDKDFALRFPAMAHITGQKRQQFIAAIEAHFKQCAHCSLKRGYDLELDGRIKQACLENKDFLLQLLKENGTDSLGQETEPGCTESESARSAHN
jgi:hypothetical protein